MGNKKYVLTLNHYCSNHAVIGLFQKKIVTPLLRISILLKLTPLNFLWNLPWPPWNFLFFSIDPPGNPCFFLNLWCTPLEFQRLLLYPLEFSTDILNMGVAIFFWKSPFLAIFWYFYVLISSILVFLEQFLVKCSGVLNLAVCFKMTCFRRYLISQIWAKSRN